MSSGSEWFRGKRGPGRRKTTGAAKRGSKGNDSELYRRVKREARASLVKAKQRRVYTGIESRASERRRTVRSTTKDVFLKAERW